MHPAKWRDTADPFALNFHTFTLEEVLGYPHAGNDVFHVRGWHQGRSVTAYIKVARHQEANLEREIDLLRRLNLSALPRLLDWDAGFRWSVTEEKPGQRLSVIVGDNAQGESFAYMEPWGEQLAQLHQLRGDFPAALHRRFMDVPDAERCERLHLQSVRKWLISHCPGEGERCFCHGDFHYANLLWQDGRISGVLDFELAGMGDREFDIAWAIIRRPGQRFMRTDEEVQRFLAGYNRCGSYDPERLHWYMMNAYAWFLGIGAEDEEYASWVRLWLDRAITE